MEKKLNFAGKIARVFVMNSKLSILLLFTMFAWGVFSFFITPKQYNPEIVAPAFQVITEYPGASSKEIYELVTKPLENKLSDIHGVDELMSQSIDGGVSVILVKFFVGENMEDSKVKIIQKIYGNLDLKPTGANDPIIKDIDPDDVPVLTFVLTSDELDDIELRRLGLEIRNKIKNVKNIANIEVKGGAKRQLKITINANEINSKGISVFEIIDSLKKNNVKLPSGDLETDSRKIKVEVDGIIRSKEDLAKIIIRSSEGHLVYLEDVAEVSDEREEVTDFVRYKNSEGSKNAVYLSLAKKKGANISQVTKDTRKKIEEFKKLKIIPEKANIEIVRDEGATANGEIFGLVINLIQAIVIVALVLFVFLGRKAAFIVAIAIPLVLATVFGVGFLAGQTINRITLFALILSLGLLVDNATVIVENVVRHIKKGDIDKKFSVINAVNEVGVGLLMSTVTTLFAFFPMAFVTGMMGPYMGPIPFFVPAALIFSLFVAFTINPFLSYVLLKNLKSGKEKGKDNEKLKNIKKIGEEKGKKLMNRYKDFLRKIFDNDKLRKKILIIVGVAFLLSVMLPAVGIVKFRMLPKADREQFFVYLDFPEGTLIEENNRITREVEDFFIRESEVVSVQSFIGEAPVIDFNGLFKGASGRTESNMTTMKINLTHHNDRGIKSEKLVQEIRPKLYKFLEKEPGVKIKLIEDPPGPPVLSTVLIKIRGEDYDRLKEISVDVEKMFYEVDEVVDIDTTRTENQQKIILKINYDKAKQAGVNTEMAAYVLRTALSGTNVSVIHDETSLEQEFIFMRFNKEDRNALSDLNSIFISSATGEKIPLTEIVTKEKKSVEDVIYNDDRMKTVYVTAEMGSRSVTYAVLDMYYKLFKYKLNDGNGELNKVSFFGVDYEDKNTGEKFEIKWGGEWEITVEVFRDLGLAMMVAIFLIYVVLVAQFRSFKTPILIMITIPLAMIGVLPGFALLGATLGIYFNATSMIGVIALAGIVVNNAIILVEYLNSFQGKGIGIKEALIETGATRMRPIVLTSLTTILGSLTIVGDPVWAGLAWSVVFGISISTVLTLVIFPVLYYSFEGKEWKN